MFRHKTPDTTEKAPETTVENTASVNVAPKVSVTENVKAEQGLRELIEKNLKWSQIIYEQNRKINNKLLWAAIFGWFKLIIIVGPIILGLIYLQPMLKGAWSQYASFFGANANVAQPASLDSFFQLFNLDPAKQEQLKALLK